MGEDGQDMLVGLMAQLCSILNTAILCFESSMEAFRLYRNRVRKRRLAIQELECSQAAKRARLEEVISAGEDPDLCLCPALAALPSPKRYWVKQRSQDWWDNFVSCTWNSEDWVSNFRMTRSTFMEIVDAIRGRMERRVTRFRQPIPVEKRVAAALWYLANTASYRTVSQQFGLGASSVAEIVLEVCFALETELFSRVVCLGHEVGKIMDGFAKLGFPHTIGALDGSHIGIRAPGGRIDQYGNRKHFCSMLLQGTVDHTGRFIDAEVGWSGRTHDAFVFRNSRLRDTMDAGLFVPGNPTVTFERVTVPALVLADGAYPLRPWLMVPFRNPRTAPSVHFNARLSRARNVVERVFV